MSGPTKRPLWALATLLPALLFAAPVLQAAPFLPQDDAVILERLPASGRGDVLRSFSQSAGSSDPAAAARLARIYIERSRAQADPRLLGYAQGILAPWWDAPNAPPETVLLRATIRQARHEFEPAMRDLDQVLRLQPDSAQAWLTRATVLRVQGHHDDAQDSCAKLGGIADPFVASLCVNAVRGLGAGAPDALAALDAMQEPARRQAPTVRAWFDAERSELLERAGLRDAAAGAYAAALARSADDWGLRAAFADLLLDLGRLEDAVTLTQGYERIDALQLRWLIALTRLERAPPDAVRQLAAGFAAAHRRGEDLHLREEARFELEVASNPQRALELALRNWDIQREPWDARLVLEAATRTGEAARARPVLDWLERTQLRDARLAPLRRQLSPAT